MATFCIDVPFYCAIVHFPQWNDELTTELEFLKNLGGLGTEEE
jgi:hypothetical protein